MRRRALTDAAVPFGLGLALALGPTAAAGSASATAETASARAGFATIEKDDISADIQVLASPLSEGRDSPSAGLQRAADHIAARFAAAGLLDFASKKEAGEEAAPVDERSYRRPFHRDLPMPKPADCELRRKGESETFTYGEHFVPVAGSNGSVTAEVLFCGFGIVDKGEHYDDLKGKRIQGRIVLIIEGEPNHRKRFDGPEISDAASLFGKLETLERAGAAGVLMMRRPRSAEGSGKKAEKSKAKQGEERADAEASGSLGFRHTWATWSETEARVRDSYRASIPVMEISPACAEELCGKDIEKLAAKADRSGRLSGGPKKPFAELTMVVKTERGRVAIDNVVGYLEGTDPELRDEYVIVGAHYDHVGVDIRGRIGFGADDNASGTAVLLELAEAFAASPPRRSMIFCAFAAEEDGLVGSREFCRNLPVEKDAIAAMLNLDMVGRGDAREVAVIGIEQNPGFEDVLTRARRLEKTGVDKLVLRQGQELFRRSDHFSFHKIGVPALFFFEGLPITRNKDYHTWRDTPDKLDLKKITHTARLAFNTLWLLATDDERLPAPREG